MCVCVTTPRSDRPRGEPSIHHPPGKYLPSERAAKSVPPPSLRLTVTAVHTPKQIDDAVRALAEAARRNGVGTRGVALA